MEPYVPFFSGPDLPPFVDLYACNCFHRVGMKMDASALFQRLGRWQQCQARIDSVGGVKHVRRGKYHPTSQIFLAKSSEVQCCALPGHVLVDCLSVNLDPPHANPTP